MNNPLPNLTWSQVNTAIPLILLALLLLLAGLVLGAFFRLACERILTAMRFDLMTARSGLDRFFRRNGFDLSTIQIFARLLQWLVIFLFAMAAIEKLNLPGTTVLISSAVEYLLRLAVAFAILVFGLMGAAVLKEIVKNAATRADVPFASMIGDIVYGAVFFFSGAAALDHLNIAREIVIIAFTIVFGSFCLALALAFGLGGQETARRWLDELTRRRAAEDPTAAPSAPAPEPPAPSAGGDGVP
jgi:hypothetical protein